MTGQTFDEKGLASKEQILVGNLRVNLITGKTTAAGQGWMTQVRRGGSELPAFGLGQRSTDEADRSESRQSPFTYMKVRFQRGIEGNIHQRKVTFDNQVRCVYGPVESWDAEIDPNEPIEPDSDGVLMSCDRLTVTQMQMPTRKEPYIEMEATGNTVVEGDRFTAQSVRMTYDESKDLLILDGNGSVNAEIYYEPYPGGPRSKSSAQKIQYSPSRKSLQVDGSPSFEFTQPGNP
jgi:hypothetical protein